MSPWFSALNLLMVSHESNIENNVALFALGTPAALTAGLVTIYLRMQYVKRIQLVFLVRRCRFTL